MNQAQIQAKIYAGYAKAAIRLGATYAQFRPTGPSSPIAPANQIATLLAEFQADSKYNFTPPALYAKPLRYGLLDGTGCEVGDYFVGAGGTFFLIALQPLAPIAAVACNATLNLLRPTSGQGVGALPYNGDVAAQETPLLTGWPASMLQGTKGEKGDVVLPGDVRMPWFNVLMPALASVPLKTGDIIYDQLTRRYKLSSCELTPLGWRLTCLLAMT